MIEVPARQVDVVAAELRAMVTGNRIVALGGGRVIDVAIGLAAADPPRGLFPEVAWTSFADWTQQQFTAP